MNLTVNTPVRRIITLALGGLLAATTALFAQNAPKEEVLVNELKQSGILRRYQEYRRETEKQVALYKVQEGHHSAEQEIEMKYLYAETAAAFEDFLFVIRNDMLDPRTRRFVQRHTEAYVESRLHALDQIYQEKYVGKFYPAWASACGHEASSMRAKIPVLPELAVVVTPIVNATVKVMEYLDGRRTQDLAYFKKILDEEWIRPNRFTPWDSIQ